MASTGKHWFGVEVNCRSLYGTPHGEPGQVGFGMTEAEGSCSPGVMIGDLISLYLAGSQVSNARPGAPFACFRCCELGWA